MCEEILIHLKLIRVLIVISSLITNLLLPGVALDASLESSLLVVERFENRSETILSLKVVLIDQSHQLLKSVLSLQSLLLCLSVPFRFLLVDRIFVLVAVLSLIESDLNCDQVTVHTMNHMLALSLDHFALVVFILDRLKLVQSLVDSASFALDTILNRCFIDFGLLQISLLLFKFTLFGQHSFVNIVVFLTNSTQSRTHFFRLFVAKFPGWDDVVGLKECIAWNKVVLSSKVIITMYKQ